MLILFKVSNKDTKTTFNWNCSNIFIVKLEYIQYNGTERYLKQKKFPNA